jgi:GR25 family glycosyltransferase involved in LPS biosynthesis
MDIPIIYINLDRSIKRNERMCKSLEKLDVKFYRVQGIDSKNINKNALKNGEIQEFKYKIKDNIDFRPREKEIAIILSHLRALKKIINENINVAIILEDDISFQYVHNWNEKINDIIANAPNDWKILKLHTSDQASVENNIKLLQKNILYTHLTPNATNSAGCYIIKKETAIEILEKYENNGLYTFPYKNEHCVCEHVVFTNLMGVYMFTLPIISVVENNITCVGNQNPLDEKSNKVIEKYWKLMEKDKNKIFVEIDMKYIDKPEKMMIPTLKKMMENSKK